MTFLTMHNILTYYEIEDGYRIDYANFKYIYFLVKMLFFSFLIKFSSDTCHYSNIQCPIVSTITFD